MKILKFFRPSRSISIRLTWHVTGTVFIIMAVIFAIILGLMWIMGTALLAIFFQTNMKVAEANINQSLFAVERIVQNYVPEVKERLSNPDELYSVVGHIVALNPNISGSAIAFAPNYFPKIGTLFSPYAYRDSTGIKFKQLGNSEYNYPRQKWFEQAMQMGKGSWSEPYFDKGGGEVAMTTYTLPLYDKQDKLYAVLTADLTLDWLYDLQIQMDSIFNNRESLPVSTQRNSYSFIVTSKGNFIAHSQHEHVMNMTIQDYFREICHGENDTTIVNNIQSGREGLSSFLMDGKLQFVHYSPIKDTDWTIVVVTPFSDYIEVLKVTLSFFAIIMFVGLFIVAVVCHFAIVRITKPLRQFSRSADEIARGNFSAPLPIIITNDEMRLLHDSFTSMQTSLTSRIEELKIVNESKGRLESELLIAHRIQMSMLPKEFPPYPERDDIDIYALLTPAREVGGDLYDFYIRDEKLFFCIGDVSGKGIPASLVMAVIKAMFRTLSNHESNPAKIISHINESISNDNDSNMFITLFIGILDLPTGRLRYCNGGHNPPITINGDDIRYLEARPNIPVGIDAERKYEEQQTTMPCNASIFLYTDGLNEAENKNHEELGDEQVIEKLEDVKQATPKEQIRYMMKVVKTHTDGAEQSDDLTMMAIKYKSPQQEIKMQAKLTLTNQIDEIPRLATFVEEIGEQAGLDPALTLSLNLALEEAVTNVILYAYPKDTEGQITIDAQLTDKRLKLVIRDSGIPFDPTTQEEADITLGVEERPIGGLGIYLVRKIMDTVNYERINDTNILTLVKIINNEEGGRPND